MYFLIIYLIIINAAGFFSMGCDKQRARRHRWRTPESVLLTIAFIGGSFGSLLGMRIFHHKTKHKKFTILIPLFLVLHIALIALFIFDAF